MNKESIKTICGKTNVVASFVLGIATIIPATMDLVELMGTNTQPETNKKKKLFKKDKINED